MKTDHRRTVPRAPSPCPAAEAEPRSKHKTSDTCGASILKNIVRLLALSAGAQGVAGRRLQTEGINLPCLLKPWCASPPAPTIDAFTLPGTLDNAAWVDALQEPAGPIPREAKVGTWAEYERQPAVPVTIVYQPTLSTGTGSLYHPAPNYLAVEDVAQHGIGDCYLGSAYMALVTTGFGYDIVNRVSQDAGSPVGYYKIKLRNSVTGTDSSYALDDKFPRAGSDWLGFSPTAGVHIMPFIEKAWVKHLEVNPSLRSNSSNQGYQAAHGGPVIRALQALSGREFSTIQYTDEAFSLVMTSLLDTPTTLLAIGLPAESELPTRLQSWDATQRKGTLHDGSTLQFQTVGRFHTPLPVWQSKDKTQHFVLPLKHAYAVMRGADGSTNSNQFTVRNPWGWSPSLTPGQEIGPATLRLPRAVMDHLVNVVTFDGHLELSGGIGK